MKTSLLTRFWWVFALILALMGGIAAVFAVRDWRSAAVTIEWSTATELDTAGFHLYRAESADGFPQRVTSELIPSAADALTGGEYQYQDSGLLGGKTYFYWLEDVSMQGATKRHGPIEVVAQGQVGFAAVLSVLFLGGALLSVLWFAPTPQRAPVSAEPEQE
ncbi:MAG: hypothetical protein OHK0052_24320 [Anaerolineales bacterium]